MQSTAWESNLNSPFAMCSANRDCSATTIRQNVSLPNFLDSYPIRAHAASCHFFINVSCAICSPRFSISPITFSTWLMAF
jgi:hypothetical protein